MAQVAGFGFTLEEIQFVLLLAACGLLAVNVFVVHPANFFDAVQATGDVIAPTGADFAKLGTGWSQLWSGNAAEFVLGLVSSVTVGLIVLLKIIVCLSLAKTIILDGIYYYYSLTGVW